MFYGTMVTSDRGGGGEIIVRNVELRAGYLRLGWCDRTLCR
jgi:hypothetical protein